MNRVKRRKPHPFGYFRYLRNRIRRNPRAFRVYSVLRLLVIAILIRSIWVGNLESAAICILSLVLFLIPTFMERQLHVEIPAAFQIIIYLFIFAAEILGEIDRFYTRIPGWDTMLHTLNGFLCGAIGYSTVDLFNRSNEKLDLSPFYLSMAAFCFSMTIGVCWEFIEFFVDSIFYLDMQKDYITGTIGSVMLDPNQSQVPFRISNITETVIRTADGAVYTIEGGYLDIGLVDTMKDLFVNFAGALIFGIVGWLYQTRGAAKDLTEKLLVKKSVKEEPTVEEYISAEKAEKEIRREERKTKIEDWEEQWKQQRTKSGGRKESRTDRDTDTGSSG